MIALITFGIRLEAAVFERVVEPAPTGPARGATPTRSR